MQSSPNTLSLPTYGTNFAPARTFVDLRNKSGNKSPVPVCDAFKERFNHYNSRDKEVWREIYAVGQLVDLFIQGKQLLVRSPYTGGYRVLPIRREDESTRRAINLMQFYATNCIRQWVMSNPDIKAVPASDRDEAVEAAKAADIITQHYENKFYTAWFNQQEALLALEFGTYLNRIRVDGGEGGLTAIRAITEERETRFGQGTGYCGECGKFGTADDFALPQEELQTPPEMQGQMPPQQSYACPQCQNQYPLVEPAPSANLSQVTGTEKVKVGDLVCDQLPLLTCRWDLTKRAEESSWFIHQQRVEMGAVRRLLGNIKIKGNPDDQGLDILEALAKTGQPLFGDSGGGDRKRASHDPAKMEEMWLSPDDYSDITISQDEETVSGGVLKAGKLTDTFPDGLVALGLNNMTTILGLYRESHKNHITSGVWHMRPLSGTGRPISDTVEVQKRANNTDSQQLAYWSSSATPAVLYDPNVITMDDARYLGSPKQNVPVDLTMLPETRKLADAVHQLTPGTIPGQFVQYTQEFLGNMFQLTSHVTDFSGGLPGVDNRTATGAQIAAANSASLFAPLLQIKGDVRRRAAEITVELYRDHIPIAKYFPLRGKYGREQGVMLSGADLNAEIVFEVVQDSELPKNYFTKREDARAFYMELFGGYPNFIMAKKEDPIGVEEAARIYNVQIETDSFDYVAQLCRKRFNQMKAVSQMIQDPAQLVQAIQPPISAYESQHEQKRKWWQDFLDTDDALESPMNLRFAVEQVIDKHFEYTSMQGMAQGLQQGTVEAAANAPQNAQQQETQAGQQTQDAQSQRQQLEAQGQQADIQSQEAQAQRQFDSGEAQASRDHEMRKMNKDHQNKLELARVGQKAKAA